MDLRHGKIKFDNLTKDFFQESDQRLDTGMPVEDLINDKPVNVSQVRKLSPFRYPGGKTWLVPEVRNWLVKQKHPALLIEPFAGGGIISLTAALEELTDRVVMTELDEDVAAVWQTILGPDAEWLCQQILQCRVNLENVCAIRATVPKDRRERALRTIILNRTQRGGILAPGASLVKAGENGRGLLSRWYPQTLVKRIQSIHAYRERITFIQGDGIAVIQQYRDVSDTAFFIDPPYTVGSKRAGKRLYTHNEVNHKYLFELMTTVRGTFLMTYDDDEEVRGLASNYGFITRPVLMKNTHHAVVYELLISRN